MNRHKPLPLFITASPQLIALSSFSIFRTRNNLQQKHQRSISRTKSHQAVTGFQSVSCRIAGRLSRQLPHRPTGHASVPARSRFCRFAKLPALILGGGFVRINGTGGSITWPTIPISRDTICEPRSWPSQSSSAALESPLRPANLEQLSDSILDFSMARSFIDELTCQFGRFYPVPLPRGTNHYTSVQSAAVH
jgi:hypothetical protein